MKTSLVKVRKLFSATEKERYAQFAQEKNNADFEKCCQAIAESVNSQGGDIEDARAIVEDMLLQFGLADSQNKY